jgi:hypothetical protein
MFSSISLPGSQRHSTRNDYSPRTHSVACYYGLSHSAGVIRWKPMTCHGCNETGHLYHACPMRRKLQETASLFTSTSEADTAARGKGNTVEAHEEDGLARHSGQPELVRSIVHHTRRGDI